MFLPTIDKHCCQQAISCNDETAIDRLAGGSRSHLLDCPGGSIHPEDEALWVIDGLVMDTTIVVQGEFVLDSIEPWLKHYYPLIKKDDIKEIRLLRPTDVIPTACYGRGIFIIITTQKDSGMRDLELNGVYTTRKSIGFAELSDRSFTKRAIEKKWKINHIQSIQLIPEGKTIVDRKGRHHTIYLSIIMGHGDGSFVP